MGCGDKSTQLVRRTVAAGEQLGGFRVADDFLLRRVPGQFALRQQLVYRDPQQWDKDITSGAGEV